MIWLMCLNKSSTSNCFLQGLDRYVKKKKLDPLDTYVPLVLEAREVLGELDAVVGEQHGCTVGRLSVYAR